MLTVTGPSPGPTLPTMNNGPIANSGCGSDARNTCPTAAAGTQPMTTKIKNASARQERRRARLRLFESTKPPSEC
jgi:hypothetical protein